MKVDTSTSSGGGEDMYHGRGENESKVSTDVFFYMLCSNKDIKERRREKK